MVTAAVTAAQLQALKAFDLAALSNVTNAPSPADPAGGPWTAMAAVVADFAEVPDLLPEGVGADDVLAVHGAVDHIGTASQAIREGVAGVATRLASAVLGTPTPERKDRPAEIRYVMALFCCTVWAELALPTVEIRSGSVAADDRRRREAARAVLLRARVHRWKGLWRAEASDAVFAAGLDPHRIAGYRVAVECLVDQELAHRVTARDIHALGAGRCSANVDDAYAKLALAWAPPVQGVLLHLDDTNPDERTCTLVELAANADCFDDEALSDRSVRILRLEKFGLRLVAVLPLGATAGERLEGWKTVGPSRATGGPTFDRHGAAPASTADEPVLPNDPLLRMLLEVDNEPRSGAITSSMAEKGGVALFRGTRTPLHLGEVAALRDWARCATAEGGDWTRARFIEWQFSFNSSLQGDRSDERAVLVEPSQEEQGEWDSAVC